MYVHSCITFHIYATFLELNRLLWYCIGNEKYNLILGLKVIAEDRDFMRLIICYYLKLVCATWWRDWRKNFLDTGNTILKKIMLCNMWFLRLLSIIKKNTSIHRRVQTLSNTCTHASDNVLDSEICTFTLKTSC